MFHAYSHIFYQSYYLDAHKDFGLFCHFDSFISISCLFANKIKFSYYCEITVDETTETL